MRLCAPQTGCLHSAAAAATAYRCCIAPAHTAAAVARQLAATVNRRTAACTLQEPGTTTAVRRHCTPAALTADTMRHTCKAYHSHLHHNTFVCCFAEETYPSAATHTWERSCHTIQCVITHKLAIYHPHRCTTGCLGCATGGQWSSKHSSTRSNTSPQQWQRKLCSRPCLIHLPTHCCH